MLSTLLLGLLAVLPAVGPAPVKITLTISGIHAGKGMVIVRFYDKPAHFLQTVYLQKTQPGSQSTLTVMAELPADTYAVAAFQDLDGNGELNMNWFRIPTEPVGFGNNFRPRFAKPMFAECAITVAEHHNTFAIALY